MSKILSTPQPIFFDQIFNKVRTFEVPDTHVKFNNTHFTYATSYNSLLCTQHYLQNE